LDKSGIGCQLTNRVQAGGPTCGGQMILSSSETIASQKHRISEYIDIE
jgi:hypothetical protein